MQKFSPLVLLCALMFLSCTKNDLKPSGTQNQQTITAQADDISDTEASPGLYHNAVTGASTLILQPGTDGNDLWFKNWDGHPYYATVCDTDVRLVKALAWKLEGTYHEVLNAIHPHPTISESIKDAIEVAYGEAIHI